MQSCRRPQSVAFKAVIFYCDYTVKTNFTKSNSSEPLGSLIPWYEKQRKPTIKSFQFYYLSYGRYSLFTKQS